MVLSEGNRLVYGYPSDVAIGSSASLMAKDSKITDRASGIRQMFISDMPISRVIWYPA